MKILKTVLVALTTAAIAATAAAITVSANTEAIRFTQSTSGYTTYYEATADAPIDEVAYEADYVTGEFTHTELQPVSYYNTTRWMSTATNTSGSTRYVCASVDLYDERGQAVLDYSTTSAGSIADGRFRQAYSQITTTSIPDGYTFHYTAYICGSNTAMSPIVEEIVLDETLTN